MNDPTQAIIQSLESGPRHWLVTGGAGFIGSHLIEFLLRHDQKVTSLDNLSTGYASNLDGLRDVLSADQWARLQVLTGDLSDYEMCVQSVKGVDLVLHQGARGSVPQSMKDPLVFHQSNVTGTINLFTAAREEGIRRIVYASSSAVYGDDSNVSKVENQTGNLLSPYAATKAICESYANAFARAYDMEMVGLRYFNIFGPRQDSEGPYAAVIPIWVKAMIRSEPVLIYGDGETTRDFAYVSNVVQANLLAATVPELVEPSRVFNVALGKSTTLNELFHQIRLALNKIRPDLNIPDPLYHDFRPGDIRHSLADASRISEELGFVATHNLEEGLDIAMEWYVDNLDISDIVGHNSP